MLNGSLGRLLKISLTLLATLGTLNACGNNEDPDSCKSTQDCPFGQICSSGGKCIFYVPECEFSTDCSTGEICLDERCVEGCTSTGECGAGQVCTGNRCVTPPPPRECARDADCPNNNVCEEGYCRGYIGQCRSVGQVCDPNELAGDGYICNNAGSGPRCYLRCKSESACLPAANPSGGVQFTAIPQRVCPVGSLCENNLFCRPSNCAGPVAGKATCDAMFPESGGNCVRVTQEIDASNATDEQNVAFVCRAAGTAEVGQPCGGAGGGIGGGIGGGGGSTVCQSGLVCVDGFWLVANLAAQGAGFCAKSCINDLQCGEGEGCIGEDEGVFGGAGICGKRCDPYNLDAEVCGADAKCFPVSSGDGFCSDLPSGPPGPKKPYDDCSADSDCPSNTLCLGGIGCAPQCDPTLRTQEERDATCPSGETFAYVKVLHLAQGAGDVDVYIDGERVLDNLSFEALGANDGKWFALSPGVHSVELVVASAEDNASPVLTQTFTLEENTATYITALLNEAATPPVQLVPYTDLRLVNAPQAGQAQARVVHAVVGAAEVDIIALPANTPLAPDATPVVLAEGLAFGEASAYRALAAGSFDIYVFPAGEAREVNNAVVVLVDVALADGQRGSVYAYGKLGGAVVPGTTFVPHSVHTFNPTSSGYCYNLAPGNGRETTASWGVCFQKCDNGLADYGTGSCDGDGEGPGEAAACSPFGSELSVCFQRGAKQLGETCAEDECASGLFCDRAFTRNGTTYEETGVCRSYCARDGAVNNNLHGCDAAKGETCLASDRITGLGECRIACQQSAPGSFQSPSCPAGQQTCYTDQGAQFCHQSGQIAVGDPCVAVAADGRRSRIEACVPGALCASELRVPDGTFDQLLELYLTPGANDTTLCRQMCRPFLGGGQSDCPEDFGCMPLLPSQQPTVRAGVCMPKVSSIGENGECPASEYGRSCGDGGLCSLSEAEGRGGNVCAATAECFHLCDPVTKIGCPAGQRCREQGSQDSRTLFIGSYGICADAT